MKLTRREIIIILLSIEDRQNKLNRFIRKENDKEYGYTGYYQHELHNANLVWDKITNLLNGKQDNNTLTLTQEN